MSILPARCADRFAVVLNMPANAQSDRATATNSRISFDFMTQIKSAGAAMLTEGVRPA
jgi:hypothetical protein